ncbi:hypothetical protein [Chryseobacterium balustinum]|uniref:hypothetical protein n=1 Tax=Chryseobacterium balustinum TaxID=246 RepID=UPI003CF85B80
MKKKDCNGKLEKLLKKEKNIEVYWVEIRDSSFVRMTNFTVRDFEIFQNRYLCITQNPKHQTCRI